MVATLFRLCLLRANPQDLPASYALLVITGVGYGAAEMLGLLDTVSLRQAFNAALIDIFMMSLLTIAALRWRGFSLRLPQTLSALFGAGAVLTLAIYILQKLGASSLSSVYLGPLFVAWWFVVYTHVLRHSLTLDIGAAAGVCAVYLVASVVVSVAYLGPPAETMGPSGATAAGSAALTSDNNSAQTNNGI